MIFENSDFKIKIAPAVINQFKNHEQSIGKKESGGILLGKLYPDIVIVEEITTPNKLDRFGYRYFIRSKIAAQEIIDDRWSKTEGKLNYLGEWHTHSEKYPQPSSQDKKMIANTLETTEMEFDFVILVIIGIENTFWVGVQTKDGLSKLNRCG